MPLGHYLSIHPVMFFFAVVLLLWAGTMLGAHLRRRREATLSEESSSFKTLESAVLALLGLLVGFTFSMAVGRYDARKNLEIAEANALTNVWLRSATLPQPEQQSVRALMRQYVPVRLEFLEAGTSAKRIQHSLEQTQALQSQLWQQVGPFASAHRDPVSAQLLADLTALFNLAESRTAAFENRIPVLAWAMLLSIAFIASILVGVGIGTKSQLLRLVLPLVVASALSLVLDLDSPRSGWIRVHQLSLDRAAARIAADRP